ncbi:hypothetical protein Zmor_009435 [Zophobas morio]|uniref:Uncharacterized protein n=1 Tax=Zophobas morio TaxID=2755281 RepID=A0AA38ILY3_9CUCU|nr:hypothetical protein Zmor_009435 [Zophobas morio]
MTGRCRSSDQTKWFMSQLRRPVTARQAKTGRIEIQAVNHNTTLFSFKFYDFIICNRIYFLVLNLRVVTERECYKSPTLFHISCGYSHDFLSGIRVVAVDGGGGREG